MTSQRRAAQCDVYRGQLYASGVLFDTRVLSPAQCVEHVLSVLGSHDRLLRADDALVVLFASPRSLRAERTSGLLVAEQAGRFRTFPAREPDVLALPEGALAWLRAGTVHVITRAELVPEAPEQWLALGPVQVATVSSLGAGPLAIAPPRVEAERDLREALGIPSLSPKAAAMRRLAGDRRSVLGALRDWLRMALTPAPTRAGRAGPSTVRALAPRSPSGPLSNRLLGLLSALGGLWIWFGAQQRYLRKLHRLFESGDTLEALRHAIPLGGKPGDQEPRLALLPPGRRTDLTIGQPASGAGSVMPMADDWVLHLRARYEAAFQQLAKNGQIDQAAFVLVELLRDVPRAIGWLEQHGRLRLAAELAESRGQPPGECVRLWFLAGERQRAIDLAVRHDAYVAALVRLEKRDPTAANALRLAWADHCAEAGDYLQAGRVALNVPQADALVDHWLELASRVQGAPGLAAWLLRLERTPALAPEAHAALSPLLDEPGEHARQTRESIAALIVSGAQSEALAGIAAPLVRALLRDNLETSGASPDARTFSQLAARVPALRADLPELLVAAPSAPGAAVRKHHIGLVERGSIVLYDAVPLPDGGTVVALGELGVMLLSSAGRRVCHWEREPVYELVPATRGSHVITLAKTGNQSRLGRLDVATRKHTRWLDLPLTAHADRFDALTWYVGVSAPRRAVVYLDATDSRARALWQVEMDTAISQLVWSAHNLDVLTHDARTGAESWSYELPAQQLRSRVDVWSEGMSLLAGERRVFSTHGDEARTGRVKYGQQSTDFPLPARWLEQSIVAWGGRWPYLWLESIEPEGRSIEVLVFADNALATPRHCAHIWLEGTHSTARVRMFDSELMICDDLGRVTRVSLVTGQRTVWRI